MTTMTLQRPRLPECREHRRDERVDLCAAAPMARAAGGGPTLDDVIVGAWEGLTADCATACVICGGTMRPRYGAGARPVGGRCEGCGSTLG